MNYYSHHIGDFNSATRHLTRVERALYRDAIELYYDTESVLTLDFDRLCRRLLAHSDSEKEALVTVLTEFFIMSDSGYSHKRCDAEIAKYRANTSNKAKAGIASAAARQQKSTGVQQTFNEPITNNQEPITNNHIKTKAAPINFYGADAQIVADFVKQRKTKPTQTGIDGMKREAEKADISFEDALKTACVRGWQSFKADWVKGESRGRNPMTPVDLLEINARNNEEAKRLLFGNRSLEAINA